MIQHLHLRMIRALRSSILVWAFLAVMSGCSGRDSAAAAPRSQAGEDSSQPTTKDAPMVSVRVFNDKGELVGPVSMPKVIKSDSLWQKQLTPEQYRIARNKGTERAFCGTLLDNKKEGVYSCVCCGLPLFASNAKFNSGTGWPSFFQPIAAENVTEHSDNSYGMVRTEILCTRCDGHLGHVFDDGPKPTGQRHCLNSESLTFTPAEDVTKLADPILNSAKPQAAVEAKDAQNSATSTASRATIVFAGGCFWCVEAVFEELDGVIEVISGYAGGTKETANYTAVCTGKTGHAEAVQIVYDPSKISFEKLLEVHFATHDPTTLNRQGNDTGPQYRSAIFYANDEEKQIAQAFIADLNDAKIYSRPIVTALEPLTQFYPAEAYHQNYVCFNPNQSYVRGVALPKVAKVREKFKSNLKETSPLNAVPR